MQDLTVIVWYSQVVNYSNHEPTVHLGLFRPALLIIFMVLWSLVLFAAFDSLLFLKKAFGNLPSTKW